jgi:hypothetical protein
MSPYEQPSSLVFSLVVLSVGVRLKHLSKAATIPDVPWNVHQSPEGLQPLLTSSGKCSRLQNDLGAAVGPG